MTREEIREIILAPLRMCAHKPEVYTPEMCTVDIIDGLAQVGVVIKVDNKEIRSDTATNSRSVPEYVAVEPLIDERH